MPRSDRDDHAQTCACSRRRPRRAGSGQLLAQRAGTPPRRISTMDIKRSGSQPSGKGPADYFTGTVRVDPLFQATEPARVVGASVTFEPGARTAWHTHPLGQTLIVTAGCGWVQRGAGRSRRSGPATWSGSRPARSTGTAPDADHRHDAYRHSGTARRQDGRLDGKGQRRTVRAMMHSSGRLN